MTAGAAPRALSGDSAFVAQAIERSGRHAPQPGQPSTPTTAHAGQSPIKARPCTSCAENRTYDQVYGDLGKTRHDVKRRPRPYEYLASATSARSRDRQPSFASGGQTSSSDGEGQRPGSLVDDVRQRDRLDREGVAPSNYSNRNRGSDFLSPVAEPERCSLFQSALARQEFSRADPSRLRNLRASFYGAITPDGNGLPGEQARAAPSLGPNSAPLHRGRSTTGRPAPRPVRPARLPRPDAGGSTHCFPSAAFPIYSYNRSELPPTPINGGRQPERGRPARRGPTSSATSASTPMAAPAAAGPANGHGLANFSYMVLPEDHTTRPVGHVHGRGQRLPRTTPALGEIISALSHSDYWSSTAVFVGRGRLARRHRPRRRAPQTSCW